MLTIDNITPEDIENLTGEERTAARRILMQRSRMFNLVSEIVNIKFKAETAFRSDDVGEAEDLYQEALAKCQELSQYSPKRQRIEVALINIDRAEMYKESFEIDKVLSILSAEIPFLTECCKTDPDMVENGLANALCLQGEIHLLVDDDYSEAEHYYLSAVELYNKIHLKSPNNANIIVKLVSSYSYLGMIYKRSDTNLEKSKSCYEIAFQLAHRLISGGPIPYGIYFISVCDELSELYYYIGEYKNSIGVLSESLNLNCLVLDRIDAKKDWHIFYQTYSTIAKLYTTLARNYAKLNDSGTAEDFFGKASDIQKRLIEVNQEKYEPYLAQIFNYYAVFNCENGNKQKAYELLKMAYSLIEKYKNNNDDCRMLYNSMVYFSIRMGASIDDTMKSLSEAT